MMKLLISTTLLAAIFLSYYLLSSLVGEDVSVPVNTLNFSQSGSEIKKLQAFNVYENIAKIPLFDADREPVKVEVKKKTVRKKVVQKKLLVKALGIAVTDEGILGVVKDMKTGKILRLRINEEIDGWILKSVSANSFVFSKDETEKVIKFKNGE